MDENRADQLFKQIASDYVRQYGSELRQELAELEQQNVRYVTPRMDRAVKAFGKSNRTKRYLQGFSALAACILLVLLIPIIFIQNNNLSTAPQAPPARQNATALEEAADYAEDMQNAPPMIESEKAAGPELMPLSFALPENFSVADAKLDNGKSVYHLADTGLDDVVLTMEIAEQPDEYEGLTELTINDSSAYARATPDYKLLAFQKDGVSYVLTCRYDFNTLVSLGKTIL